MNENETVEMDYEAPTLEVVGSLQDITKNGALFNSDDGQNPDTALPVPVS
jgi:hypothetical protein